MPDFFAALEEDLKARARGNADLRRKIGRIAAGGLLALSLGTGAMPAGAQAQETSALESAVQEVVQQETAYQEMEGLALEMLVDLRSGQRSHEDFRRHLDDLYRVLGHHGQAEAQVAVAEALADVRAMGGLHREVNLEYRDTLGRWLEALDRRDSRVNSLLREIREEQVAEARAASGQAERDARSQRDRQGFIRDGERQARRQVDGAMTRRLVSTLANRSIQSSRDNVREAQAEARGYRAIENRLTREIDRLDRDYVPGVRTLESDTLSTEARNHVMEVHSSWGSRPERSRGPSP